MRVPPSPLRLPAALVAATLLVPSAGLPAQEPVVDRGERIARVESSLTGPRRIAGHPVESWTIAERMAHHGVPGVSVAVLEDGEVAWAKAYGVKDVETGAPVTPATLFQAASISKPVSVVGMLRLVEAGRVELDEPVGRYLRSWTIPPHDFERPITLRRLASHTAGTTVHGFPGYARPAERPGTAGVLRGEGNTDPVVVDLEPGSAFRYSGGGTTILQLVVEDVTGLPFEDYMADAVLGPAGMERSTFAQPLPEARWADAASGHRPDGAKVEGDWHVYPEKAAAGLWTTPTDLGRFAIAVLESLRGDGDALLARETAEEMLTPVLDGYGLGFGVVPEVGRFGHGGANEGFRASLAAFRDGRGVVVMTNSDRGSALAEELLLAVGRVYGWDAFQPEVLTPVSLPAARRAALEATFEDEARGIRLALSDTGEGLFEAESDRLPPTTFVPISPTELADVVVGIRLTVEWDGDRVVALRTEGVELVPAGG